MKLKMNIYLRIFLITLLIVDIYLILLDDKNKWLIAIRNLIVPIIMIITSYVFWKQKQKENNNELNNSNS
jgi:uncharacterized membrane protein YkvI